MKQNNKVKCKVCGSDTTKRNYKITGNDGVARSVYLCLSCPRSTLIHEA